MPSTREQQLARARAVRQAQRARERARRRRLIAAVAAAVLVLAGAGTAIGFAVSGGTKKSGTSGTATVNAAAGGKPASNVACGGPVEQLAPAKRMFSAEPKLTVDTQARYTMTLDTSCGPITAALEAAKAPHTVNLLAFLAADHFYDGTKCHRSTDSPSLTVLQCGDPTGTGAGQIGFTIGEENLTGATYPRGTIAMAKTSAAHSTSSQFFLVDKDSQLPPQYTVAGHLTSGLDVLDKLLAVGDDASNGPGDGAPKKTIYLEKVTVTKS